MGALVSACKKGLSIKNTRSECNESMGPTARLIAVPPGATFTKANLADFTNYVNARLHDALGARWYVLFGPDVPIRRITNNKEADVIFTADDGTQIFIRYGVLNRAFGTTEGGLCFAEAIMSLNKSGYSFIEIDNANQVMVRQNVDGTYSALKTTFVYSPSIDLADFKNPAFTNFQISIKPEEYVRNGYILQADDSSLLDLIGLADVTLYQNGAVTNSGSTRSTATDTIVKGSTGDTIDVKAGGVSLTGTPVTQTGTETTDTLLAAKIAAAITAAVATNGGYTATNAAGVLTISAPAGKGAVANGIALTATITGTITATPGGVFAGGVTGTAVLKVGIKTTCGETDLIAQFGATLVTAALVLLSNSAGTAVVPSVVAIVAGVANLTIPYLSDTYKATLAAPSLLLAAGIDGFDAATPASIVVS